MDKRLRAGEGVAGGSIVGGAVNGACEAGQIAHKVAIGKYAATKKLKPGRLPPEMKLFQAAAQRACMHTKAGYERWWNSIPGDCSLVVEYKPPTADAHIGVDDAVGRFIASYKVWSLSLGAEGVSGRGLAALLPRGALQVVLARDPSRRSR